jgi:hypothetical protein
MDLIELLITFGAVAGIILVGVLAIVPSMLELP